MKHMLKAAISAFILVISVVKWAAAEPLSDGINAETRGDYTTAVRGYRFFADRGDRDAQFYVGYMYGKGLGVQRDEAAAARDDKNDLALLATDLHPTQAANWRLQVRQGEDIVVYGFPLTGRLRPRATSPRATSPRWLASAMIAGSCKSPHRSSRGTAVALFSTGTAPSSVSSFPSSTR